MRKVTKGSAFLLSLLAIMLTTIGALYKGQDPVDAALTAVVALATMFITGSVADNGVKGKYYQEGLNKEAGDGTRPKN